MPNFLTGLSEIREGGSYHRFIRMIAALANRGFKVLVFSTSPDALKKDNVLWKQILLISKIPLKNFIFLLIFPFIVFKSILTENSKRIIVFGPIYASLLLPVRLCKKCRIYCMVRGMLSSEYGYQGRSKILKSLTAFSEKMGLHVSHRIIVVSLNLGERIRKNSGIHENKIVYLPNEIPPLSDERVNIAFGMKIWDEKTRGDELRLFAGGIITARKNYELLLETIALLKIPFHLCIAGKPANPRDEEYFSELQDQAKRLELENHLSWLGWLPREQLLGALSSSHLLVGASHHEGMSNIFLEALALDVPCLAMRTAEALELLQADELLFKIPKELAGIITHYYEDAAYKQKIVSLCRQAKDRWTFDWDAKLIEILAGG